jgi:hypothetical protein
MEPREPQLRRRQSGPVLIIMGVFVLSASTIGCERRSPLSPSVDRPPAGPAPVLTSISPALGATGGGASMTIVGTGFKRGVVVAFDGVEIKGRFDTRDAALATIYLESPAHSAGPVDLVVTNPDGAFVKSAGAYTYVSAESFDVNGSWAGFAYDGSDRYLEFTIRDSKLLSASCFSALGERFPLAIPLPAAVSNGEFSFVAQDGVMMSGRIVSALEIIGTMDVGACSRMSWRTQRKFEG